MGDFRYRVKFSKAGGLRWVGHLDLMETLRRAIRRAKLPVKYSEGFSPHMELSVALPVSVGMAAFGEYADFRLVERVSADEVVRRLNGAFPPDLRAVAAFEAEEGAKSSAALVEKAEYRAFLGAAAGGAADVGRRVAEWLVEKRGTVVVREKEREIGQDVYSVEAVGEDGSVWLKIVAAAGSGANVRAESVVEVLFGAEVAREAEYERVELVLKDKT